MALHTLARIGPGANEAIPALLALGGLIVAAGAVYLAIGLPFALLFVWRGDRYFDLYGALRQKLAR